MKKIMFASAVLFAAAALAAMPSLITIKGMKKTADTHRNNAVNGPRTVTSTDKNIFYEFELTASSPAVPDNVNVKWVVVTIGMGGHLHLGTKGEKETALPKNKPTTVESDDINIESKQVHGPRGHLLSQGETKIVGYGVRVFDGNGTMIAENYYPENEKKTMAEAFDGKLNVQPN